MTPTTHLAGRSLLEEMKEFAAFPKGTQRYIRRSLDVGLDRRDAVRRWARDPSEIARIRTQREVYRRLERVRAVLAGRTDDSATEAMLTPLVALTAFDLAERRLPCFASYRFLYERLLGARIRPWLPAAFCAAAALPYLHPQTRAMLLASLSEAAATAEEWSRREPGFFPDWVDKVELAVGA
ncbi:MAG TPA: hypothetical protein VH331_09035 [Allosphingosinicella sp.]|jgi:hypothetical protein|nr:hypothetical protein [Allosphingosinicella sp.]